MCGVCRTFKISFESRQQKLDVPTKSTAKCLSTLCPLSFYVTLDDYVLRGSEFDRIIDLKLLKAYPRISKSLIRSKRLGFVILGLLARNREKSERADHSLPSSSSLRRIHAFVIRSHPDHKSGEFHFSWHSSIKYDTTANNPRQGHLFSCGNTWVIRNFTAPASPLTLVGGLGDS